MVDRRAIAPLDKVRLHLKAVPHLGNEALASVTARTSIVYGVGSGGISPFEKILSQKAAGDRFTLTVAAGSDEAIFSHLNCSIARAIQMAPPYVMHVVVESVAPASDKEAIRAMARMAGCGGGCDCGCG